MQKSGKTVRAYPRNIMQRQRYLHFPSHLLDESTLIRCYVVSSAMHVYVQQCEGFYDVMLYWDFATTMFCWLNAKIETGSLFVNAPKMGKKKVSLL